MMLRTVRGTFEDGQVTLDEDVPGIKRADVLVVFVEETKPGRTLTYGMFRPSDGQYTTEEDFRDLKKEFEPKERCE